LQQLTGREKRIMELRFGLQGEKERTQREVADLLGISQSYISRLEKKILKKLRREMKKME
jgi:RNA polymerase sporulation-specific sigma factor